LSSMRQIITPNYGEPLDAPALGSPVNVRINDGRLMMAVIKNKSLFTCRHIGVNALGGETEPDRTGCEWIELNVSSDPAGLVQSGRVYDNSATNPRFYYCPSIMVNRQGRVVMSFAGSSGSEYIGAYACERMPYDPAGAMRPVITVKNGEAPYQMLDESGRIRWGEWSYTSLDPSDDMSIWTIQEWATALGTNIWGTWVAKIPISILTLDNFTAAALQGQKDFTLNLTGSGFYDSGPGFPDHLKVSVYGGGVWNYRITYNSSTSVSVTFDLSKYATPGPRDVILTNPDGESATAAGALTIMRKRINTIGEAKKNPNGFTVVVDSGVVTASFPGIAYIEDGSGPCGVRVLTSLRSVKLGTKLDVSGPIKTNAYGERYIAATMVTRTGAGSIEPVPLANRRIGGVDWLYDPFNGAGQRGVYNGSGPNNIGLLITTTGKVTSIGSNFFYIDDGSGLKDGTGRIGVKVSASGIKMARPKLGANYQVTGISTCYKVSRRVRPMVKLRAPADVKVL
ncbi:MAG: hypothetical protein Q7N50_11255, partial [Armatimonadota bacterium]|nr:hypothetical protein [Armatimonadota bacterium]